MTAAPVSSRGLRQSQGITALPTYGGYLLFFMMLVFPMVIELLYVKAFLFALLLLATGMDVVRRGRVRLDPLVGLVTMGLAVLNLLFVLRGLALAAPGAIKQAQVYVLFPFVYTLLMAGAASLPVLVGLHRVVVGATLVASLYAILLVLTRLGLAPSGWFVNFLSQGEAIGLHRGYVEFNLYSLNSFPFLVPFVMATLATPQHPASPFSVRRPWLWMTLIVGLIVVAFSGRRALWLVTFIAPFAILSLRAIARRKSGTWTPMHLGRILLGLLIVLGGMAWLLQSVYEYDLARVLASLSHVYDAARQEQLGALLDGWSDHWLLGAGHGASVAGSLRSESIPWAYELFYASLLFQTGVVGVVAHAAAVIWIFWMGVRLIQAGGVLADTMFPALVGLGCFLIATGTNPYLDRFDGIWVIFYPVAILNCWLLQPTQPVQGAAVSAADAASSGRE